MKVMLTGANGTVGKVFRKYLTKQGCDVCTWERNVVPINDYERMLNFVKRESPDILYHLAIASEPTGIENESWLVNYHWSSELAWITRSLDIKFVFTSTAMVFSDDAKGPFTIKSVPDAQEGYGYEKKMAEVRVLAQNPHASVVRLGWQIGEKPGSNNMIDYFVKQMKENGCVSASEKWFPACSFLEDTAKLLWEVAQKSQGIYMIDSNESWSFYRIACALNKLHGNHWKVVVNNDFVYDQRMKDQNLSFISLKERLTELNDAIA